MEEYGKNFALIGNGYIGPRHVEAIKSIGGKLLMVADIDPKKRIENIPFYTDYKFFTADPRWSDIDTVVICTPNVLHIPIAKWCRRHGKRVICEKPPGTSAKDVSETFGLKDVFVVMQLRHHPIYKKMKEENPTPENIKVFVKVKRDKSYWNGWKGSELLSGGILANLGVHYFDALANIVGTNCVQVWKDNDLPNLVSGKLRFAGFHNDVEFHIEIADNDDGQDRYIDIDNKKYRFSNKDNLSMEDLHKEVYKNLPFEPEAKTLYRLMQLIDQIKHA
uniref:Putative oxidoreductase family protein n=1 Tax=viral metagenome TaxID=1070528 RepID=A0A6H1ZDW4_9ZZZZ